jgi:hypothetical protein
MVLFDEAAAALRYYIFHSGLEGERFPLDVLIEKFYADTRSNIRALPTQVALWKAIAEFLYSRSLACSKEYRTFVRALSDDDVIVSFNWDTCLEIAMKQLGRNVSLEMHRPPSRSTWLLKPHGSIDFLAASPIQMRDPAFLREMSEIIHPQLPTVFSPDGPIRAQLMRIRTYDLTWELDAAWLWESREFQLQYDRHPKSRRRVIDRSDVGAIHLDRFLLESWPFILTPGWSPVFYEWSYGAIRQSLEQVCSEIEGVWVVGYSFPHYDKRAHAFLKGLAQCIGEAPVHIVNPAAHDLPADVLGDLFGKYCLHPVGFLEYPWSRT